jgi:2'-5' RNA ligase
VRLRRVFFAFWPSVPLCRQLAASAAPVLERIEGRRLSAEDWHVTVCFIGSVNDALLTTLQASAAALTADPFSLRFDRVEYWSEARVIAATAPEVPASAAALASALFAMARSLGLAPDEKPLRPHLTLMRGVNPLAWRMNQDRPEALLAPELVFVPDMLYLAESRPPPQPSAAAAAAEAGAAAPSYARLASWPLQR